jgi:hypothetical protein
MALSDAIDLIMDSGLFSIREIRKMNLDLILNLATQLKDLK